MTKVSRFLANIRNWFIQIAFTTKTEKLLKKIETYDVISFDLFDTLIKRNVKNPTDIFVYVEQEYNKINAKKIKYFQKERILAEKKARKLSGNAEITLDKIYEYMDYSLEEKELLKRLEIQIEKDFCVQNLEMHNIYEKCLKLKKSIYIITDMYLPEEVIKEILTLTGYTTYEKLYVSSTIGYTKNNGLLFQKINIEKNKKMLHIGDSFKADFIKPRIYGIHSVLIKKHKNYTSFCNIKSKDVSYNVLYRYINNNISKYELSNYEKFGYEILGPILYSFVNWVHNEVKEQEINNIYFLARDAGIIMNAYKILYCNSSNIYYLNISRKAVLNASLDNVSSFDDIFNYYEKMMLKKTSTVNDFFYALEIPNIDYKNIGEKLLMNLMSSEKEQIFNSVKQELISRSEKQRKYLITYLKQNDFLGKVALIDIGWNGTIQNYIEKLKLKNTDIIGLYYGVMDWNCYKSITKKGFLFDKNYGEDMKRIIQMSLGFFELLFLSTEGSTVCYEEKDGIIVPVLNDKDSVENVEKNIKGMQNMALQFIKDIQNSNSEKYICQLPSTIFFENYTHFIKTLSLKKVALFSDFEFRNATKNKLISNKSIIYYVFHPKRFYIDFSNSTCKIMFLKSVFKVKLPYFTILNKLYESNK